MRLLFIEYYGVALPHRNIQSAKNVIGNSAINIQQLDISRSIFADIVLLCSLN